MVYNRSSYVSNRYGSKASFRAKQRRNRASRPMTWRRAAGMALDLGSQSGVKYLKTRLGLNTETKYIDTDTSQLSTATLAVLQNPLVIPQGDTKSSRDGNSCRITNVNTRFLIDCTSNPTVPAMVRILAVYTPKVNGDFPTPTEILTDNTDILSHYTKNRVGYSIVYDKTFILAGFQNPYRKSKKIHKVLDHQLVWDASDTTGSRSNLLRGDYVYYVMSKVGSGVHPTITANSRVNFVDN